MVLRHSIPAAALLLSTSALAQDIGRIDLDSLIWEEKGTKNAVTVFRESNPCEGFVSVRATTVIDAPLALILSILADGSYDHQKEWVPNLVEFSIVDFNTIFDRTLYVHVDIPWPAKDRDFTYSARIVPDSSRREVRLCYRSVDGGVKPKEDVVRGAMQTLFVLRKAGESETFVDLRAVANPAGRIPVWIVNLAQRNYSYNMINRIREQVDKKKSSTAVMDEFRGILD